MFMYNRAIMSVMGRDHAACGTWVVTPAVLALRAVHPHDAASSPLAVRAGAAESAVLVSDISGYCNQQSGRHGVEPRAADGPPETSAPAPSLAPHAAHPVSRQTSSLCSEQK